MKRAKVPHFDRAISKLVLGSIPLRPDEPEAAFRLIDAYVAAGGNAIDLGTVYGGERYALVGRYLKERGRDKLIVLDKGCHHGRFRRVTRDAMAQDIEANQGHFGAGPTEFFVLHRDDPLIPAGEVVEWLNEHKNAGRIQAFGGSNWHHSRIREANEYAASHGLQGFSLSSPNLSLAAPNEPMWAECLWLDAAAREWYEGSRFPVFSWSSGGGGFFAGVDSADVRRVYHNRINFARLERVKEIAKRLGATPTQVALAWTLNQPLEIWCLIGPANLEQLEDNLGALELALTPEDLAFLEHGARA